MINEEEEMDNIALSALRYATDVSFTYCKLYTVKTYEAQ